MTVEVKILGAEVGLGGIPRREGVWTRQMASSVWGGGHAGGHSAEVPLAPLSGNAAWPLIHHSLPRTVGEWVSGNGSRKCGINGGILLAESVAQ